MSTEDARRALARTVQTALLASPTPEPDYSATALHVADALAAAGYGDLREVETVLEKVRGIVECYPDSAVSFQVGNAIAGVR